MDGITWFDYGDEAFAAARRLDRPLFLFVVASWCRYCRRMESESLADPRVALLLSESFVPVKVDKDRRPDVNERYALGGWPSCSILGADGELITSAAYLGPDELLAFLERVSTFYASQRPRIAAALEEAAAREARAAEAKKGARGQLHLGIVERVVNAILDEFDRTYGGFGGGQKFPHSEAIDFALLHFEKTGDERLRQVVELTLTQMAESPTHDVEEGGFFRYSTSRDWRSPHTEKLLETNVGLLRNYLEAHQIFERPDFRRVAEKIVQYLRTHLKHPEAPAFCGSQDSDDDYYAQPRAVRVSRRAPRVDHTIYVNWNAAAVSALFKAAAVLGDPECRREAVAVLEFLLEECYDQGRGMYHYHDGGRHILGLLTDQAYMARALLHASQFLGEAKYLEVAEDLLGLLVSKHASPQGGFYDLPADPRGAGGLRRRNVSILENSVIAEAFLRAFHLTQKEAYLEHAQRALEVFVEDFHLYGYFTAGYARAVDLFLHVPVHAVIVGARTDPATIAMVEAATRLYLPSKLVQVIDPRHDQDLLARFGLPREAQPTAFVTVGKKHVGRVTAADELARTMQEAARARG